MLNDAYYFQLTLSFPLDDGNHEIESVIIPANHFVTINVLPELQMTKSEVRDVDKVIQNNWTQLHLKVIPNFNFN